ncbi:MAG: hypothetical protein JO277_00525 [Candidatus Eremiobacteraeota bacterium]|nr:hypothetical protein [Candidatus Eremiobacteraeota bacterium]
MTNRIACIGARTTPKPILDWMEARGETLVRHGYKIVSGNAPGADQAWARGGNRADPRQVELCLPWEYFEAHAIDGRNPIRHLRADDVSHAGYFEMVFETHPRGRRLAKEALALHARNAMIVEGAHLVLGALDPDKPVGGGTLGAFRMANRLGIPAFNVADSLVRAMIDKRLAEGEDPRGKVYETGKGKRW